jgi:hypothetical protein
VTAAMFIFKEQAEENGGSNSKNVKFKAGSCDSGDAVY